MRLCPVCPAAPGKQQPTAALTLALGGLTALASLHTGGGFSPGRIAAVAAVLLLGQEAGLIQIGMFLIGIRGGVG